MDFKEINLKAFNRTGISEFCTPPEKCAYYRLEYLYSMFSLGKISKEKSIVLKNEIESEYKCNCMNFNRMLDTYKTYNENRAKDNENFSKLEKSTNKDESFKIALEILAHYVGDERLPERILNKIKE